MSQVKINKYIANDSYLNSLAKECLKDAETCPRKMLESVRELAATMFVVRIEEDTPLDNVQYDIGNIMKAMLKIS